MTRVTDLENSRLHFQSDRFFLVSNQWFFATRDEGDKGPFESREQADAALQRYLQEKAGMGPAGWDVPGARG